MPRHRWLTAVSALAIVPLVLAACGGDESTPTEPDGPSTDTREPSVAVSPAADTLVAIDAESDFSAEVVRSDGTSASDADASWSSGDTAVATVDGGGLATARAAGSVDIVASFGGAADTAQLVVSPEVDRMVVSPSTDSVDALGGRAALSADARDANGHPVAAAEARWASSDSSVAAVDSAGTVTGGMPGEADIVATAAGAADTARIVVVDPAGDQPPTVSIDSPADSTSVAPGDSVAFSGSAVDLEDGALTGADLTWSSQLDGQIGTGERVETSSLSTGDHVVTLTATDSQGQTSDDSIAVTVRQPANLVVDRMRTLRRGVLTSEHAEAGAVIRNSGGTATGSFAWELTLDGALVTRETVGDLAPGDSLRLSPRDLGTLTAGRHRVDLAVDVDGAVPESDESDNAAWDRVVSYPAGFEIELDYVSAVDSTHRAAFDSAADRWAEIITADLPEVTFSSPQDFDFCASGAGDRSAPIDDVLIFVRVDSIDGPGGTLGQAGPCTARHDATAGHPLTASSGRMTFDVADLDQLASDGSLEEVILHEMGHVLGIGSLWDSHSLVEGVATNDPIFTGDAGRLGFVDAGGDAYDGRPVPVANTGGAGTEDSHWRESVLDHELMTGFLNAGQGNPVSIVTVRSLGDQYYAVDPAAADSYQVPVGTAFRAAAGTRIGLGDDLIDVRVRGLGPDGRVLHVGEPPGTGRRR